jgi:hypothetical protein
VAERPPVPREHGAWGILLIPFATAVGVAGVWNLPVALLLVSVLCFFVARTSWLKRNYRWTAILLAGSLAAAVPLVAVWKLWWLPAFGAVAAVLAAQPTRQGLAPQVLEVGGLTLTAPAAWYAATGTLDYRLWVLNALYFAGGVFYVRMHLASAVARRPVQRVPTLIYHGALAVVAALWPPVGLAFLPAIARALVGVIRLSPTLRIKRLGWTEVAYSLVFAALVILALQ